MPRTSKIVSIPKPARVASNNYRPAGALLQAKVSLLHKALVKHHAEVERLLAIDLSEIMTELDAADYAERVVPLLYPHHVRRCCCK